MHQAYIITFTFKATTEALLNCLVARSNRMLFPCSAVIAAQNGHLTFSVAQWCKMWHFQQNGPEQQNPSDSCTLTIYRLICTTCKTHRHNAVQTFYNNKSSTIFTVIFSRTWQDIVSWGPHYKEYQYCSCAEYAAFHSPLIRCGIMRSALPQCHDKWEHCNAI